MVLRSAGLKRNAFTIQRTIGTILGMNRMSTDAPLLGIDEINALLEQHFPQIHEGGRTMHIEAVGHGTARVRLALAHRHTRPGGTVSGPAMFLLADFAVYVALIGALGPSAIAAVTSNLNINFLAKPEPKDVIADVRLLRHGRRLAVGEVEMTSEGGSELIAHAVATYVMPAAASGR